MTDPLHNRIAAYWDSSTIVSGTNMMGQPISGTTVFAGTPLNNPAGLAINPLNGDLLVVNQADNLMVEIQPDGTLVGSVTVDPTTPAGGALFGLTATTDGAGNLMVYFTDDNDNTLKVLKFVPPIIVPPTATPEAPSAVLFGIGVAVIGLLATRRSRRRA